MELRTLRYFVAVAEELHFGRAAARLHMSQPPLSRAIRRLEADLGATLLHRSPAGVTLTPVGAVLLGEARALLDRAARTRVRVAEAAGTATLTVGLLGDGTDPRAVALAHAYRRRHPRVEVVIRDAELTDPTCGLAAGAVDVALTRGPFDETGLTVREVGADPVGALLRADDLLADRASLRLAELADRRWFRFPQDTDRLWQSYWHGGTHREGPVVRAVEECRQAVLWNGTVGMTPLGHEPPEGLAVVPLADMAPSRVVVAWNTGAANPLVASFAALAATAYRAGGHLTSPAAGGPLTSPAAGASPRPTRAAPRR
ncbi:LysR family transcriptional regulator [Streptomyces sp. NPDC091377]|uniref:LysR family transcriptional regulator n=1 Tax=Streptomyces sp. NPDC091377 TaxID=3365995 RepID=UPI003801CF0F